jgi:hypothetical protein
MLLMQDTYLLQIADKLYHTVLHRVHLTIHTRIFSGDRNWGIVVVNPTTVQSRPRQLRKLFEVMTSLDMHYVFAVNYDKLDNIMLYRVHLAVRGIRTHNFRCFSPGTPVSSTNKTDRHDITAILLKEVLNTITISLPYSDCNLFISFPLTNISWLTSSDSDCLLCSLWCFFLCFIWCCFVHSNCHYLSYFL